MIAAADRVEDVPVVIMLQQAMSRYRAGNMAAAEALLCDVLSADPMNAHAAHLQGLVAHDRGDNEMAEALIDRSIQIAPHSRAYLNLGVVKQHRGDLDAAIACYREAIRREPDYADAWTNLLFALDMHPFAPWTLLLETRRAFDKAVCAPITARAPEYQNTPDPDRRLRIGYVGGDFRTRHSAASSFGWITAHDKAAIEVYLYSTHLADDPTAAAFKAAADVWSEVGDLPPGELAGAILDDQIDILVDLGGASQGNRALTFACKPAPIQVSGWGYPHGLGIGAIDYMVGDPVSTPPEHASHYPERILSLPLLMGYRHTGPLPDVGEAPQARNGYRTYGYLGRALKVTAPTIALWAELLRADPTGRLLLKSDQYTDRAIRSRVGDGLSALGVSPDRIAVRDSLTSREDHLAAYREIDVALDPLVHGGGQTTLDACLMGVTTVTLPGETVSGRITAAILTHIGCPRYIAQTKEEYVHLALEWRYDNRSVIRALVLGSTAYDTTRYAQSVEAAYRDIWRRYLDETV